MSVLSTAGIKCEQAGSAPEVISTVPTVVSAYCSTSPSRVFLRGTDSSCLECLDKRCHSSRWDCEHVHDVSTFIVNGSNVPAALECLLTQEQIDHVLGVDIAMARAEECQSLSKKPIPFGFRGGAISKRQRGEIGTACVALIAAEH